jgi:hypothetical protein
MKRLHCFLVLPLLLACLLTGTASGQNAPVDKDRMERDIDIMEKVLNELFKNAAGNRSRNVHFSSGRTAQGSYVPGYGVLFIAPVFSGSFNFRSSYNYVYSSGRPGGPARTVIVKEGDWKGKMKYTDPSEEEKAKGEKQKEKTGKNAPPAADQNRRLGDAQDSILQAHTNLVTTNLREFLANYADAIGQLSPNDRVMIIYNENARNSDHYVSVGDCESCETRVMPRISAEVKREDLAAFRSGKMNRKELESRIRVSQDTPGKENYAEYKVFAGILESLYPVGREVPYRVRNIGYHVLPSFGVIYLVDMGLRNEGHNVVTLRDGEVRTKVEKDSSQARIRTEAYGQFRNDIREAVLDYGRTLRNLSADQVILLSVALPTCEGCNVPARANVSVKKSVLEAYEQNKMSRQQALDAITVGK